MGKYFGTDGIRGLYPEPLSEGLAFRVGRAVAALTPSKRARVLIGRDTRRSGEALSHALTAGLLAGGADVLDVGVLPTPAVAFLTEARHADAGIVISASHNPAPYNGIKLFGADAAKSGDAPEAAVERLLDGEPLPDAAVPGRYQSDDSAAADYQSHLLRTVGTDLSALKIAVDCANGAAFRSAPAVLRALGTKLTLIHAEPDGENINRRCGSTDLRSLRETVVTVGADLGIAFDGDADRCLCVAENGSPINGDLLMTLLALEQKRLGKLSGDTVVGTVMSNSGVECFCLGHGIRFERAPVGDRFVAQRMAQTGAILGGEPSGHLILREFAATGDGLLTALQFLQLLARRKAEDPAVTASALIAPIPQYPQIVRSVAVPHDRKEGLPRHPSLEKAADEVRRTLGGGGRLLLRASGTEDLLRILLEGPDAALLNRLADRLETVITALCRVG